MHGGWYGGVRPFGRLAIRTMLLATIHADAFNCEALHDLSHLRLEILYGLVRILDNAFNGLEKMQELVVMAEHFITYLPVGLFDCMATTIARIAYRSWSNNVNLNEMFANRMFDELRKLSIAHVDMPQSRIRVLAANNFTMFRYLVHLDLIDCGIEVIDDDAFDVVGRTLVSLDLSYNYIKILDVRMFRTFIETGSHFFHDFDNNALVCTCRLFALDVLICPQRGLYTRCIECEPKHFDVTACGIHRVVNFRKMCAPWKVPRIRLINVRMGYEANAVTLETNYTSRFRVFVLYADAAPRPKNCTERAKMVNFKCSNIDKFVKHLDLNATRPIAHVAVSIGAGVVYLPQHFMTVNRHTVAVDEVNDDRIWIAVITVVFGAAIGFASAICAMHLRRQYMVGNADASDNDAVSTTNEFPPYEYVEPLDTGVEHLEEYNYDEICERQNNSNYIELEDSGYMAVN